MNGSIKKLKEMQQLHISNRLALEGNTSICLYDAACELLAALEDILQSAAEDSPTIVKNLERAERLIGFEATPNGD